MCGEPSAIFVLFWGNWDICWLRCLLQMEGFKHRDEPRFPQKPRHPFLLSPARDASMSAAHHHQVPLDKIFVILIFIGHVDVFLDLLQLFELCFLELEKVFDLALQDPRGSFRVPIKRDDRRISLLVVQLVYNDFKHFLDILQTLRGGLSMGLLFSNFVVSNIYVIGVATAIGL